MDGALYPPRLLFLPEEQHVLPASEPLDRGLEGGDVVRAAIETHRDRVDRKELVPKPLVERGRRVQDRQSLIRDRRELVRGGLDPDDLERELLSRWHVTAVQVGARGEERELDLVADLEVVALSGMEPDRELERLVTRRAPALEDLDPIDRGPHPIVAIGEEHDLAGVEIAGARLPRQPELVVDEPRVLADLWQRRDRVDVEVGEAEDASATRHHYVVGVLRDQEPVVRTVRAAGTRKCRHGDARAERDQRDEDERRPPPSAELGPEPQPARSHLAWPPESDGYELASSLATLTVSMPLSTMRPSRMCTMRSAASATSRSWVTSRMV